MKKRESEQVLRMMEVGKVFHHDERENVLLKNTKKMNEKDGKI